MKSHKKKKVLKSDIEYNCGKKNKIVIKKFQVVKTIGMSIYNT